MPFTDIVDLEEALKKTGAELFKELYRIYPVADAGDYCKNGQWRNDLLKTDILLIESHRRECGAPDVPDLDDIKLPANMPQAGAGWLQQQQSLLGASALYKPAMTVKAPGVQGVATTSPTPTPVAGISVVEIRLIALFVAKWKVDPVAAKATLTKLTGPQRRYVIQNFKATAPGAAALSELETYIKECEESKAWDTTPATTGATKGTVAPPKLVVGGITISPAGLKRPLTAVTPVTAAAWQQNKLMKA